MSFLKHQVPLLALAAAISTDLHAEITAVDDELTLTSGQASVITLQALVGNDVLNGSSVPLSRVYIDTTFIGGGQSQYYDSNGNPVEDPFTESGSEDFVILCPFSPDSGSLIINESGRLVFDPESDELTEATFNYDLQEHVFNGEGHSFEDIDSATVGITLSAQTAEGLAALVQGRNRQRVAQSLERLCNGENAMSTELAARCEGLLDLAESDPGQIDGIIAQITPEEALALRRLASEIVRHQSDLVFRQQQVRRQQAASEQVELGGTVMELLNYQGGNAGDNAGRWSSFISVRQDETEYSGTDLEAAFDMDTSAMTVGADYRLDAHWLVGMALGWSRQDLAFGQDAGDVDASTYQVMGYLSRNLGAFNLDMQLGYGSGDYDLTRSIRYSGVNTATEGATEADLYTFNLQLDWNWQHAALALRPYARVDYLHARVDGYRERGGMGWAMEVGDQDMKQITSSLGLDTTYAMSFPWGVLVPGLNLGMSSQASDDYSPVAFRFLDDESGAGDFTLLSEGEDSLFYHYEVNLVAVLTRGASLFFGYRTTASQDDMDGQQVNLGGRLEF